MRYIVHVFLYIYVIWCTFSAKQKHKINPFISCEVNGGWGGWNGWGTCSMTCRGGSNYRTRHCNNPAPMYGGSSCSGNSVEYDTCYGNYCPGNKNWKYWTVRLELHCTTWNIFQWLSRWYLTFVIIHIIISNKCSISKKVIFTSKYIWN